MPANTKLKESNDTTLYISRVFDAPRALVFKAWTDPAQLAQWFYCKGFVGTFMEADVRVGGKYRFGMRGTDGNEIIAGGVYREITAPERLVYTHAWESNCKEENPDVVGMDTLVTVDFIEQGDKTLIEFSHSGLPDRATVDSHTKGWTSFLEVLAEYLAG